MLLFFFTATHGPALPAEGHNMDMSDDKGGLAEKRSTLRLARVRSLKALENYIGVFDYHPRFLVLSYHYWHKSFLFLFLLGVGRRE